MYKQCKRILLVVIILLPSLFTNNIYSQTVTGNGWGNHLTKWSGPTTVVSSLLKDDGNTISLGNGISATPWNLMYIRSSIANVQTTGLNVELFGVAPTGTGQGLAINVQNSRSNYGINCYAFGGEAANGGYFVAKDGQGSVGVYGCGDGGQIASGASLVGRNAEYNYGALIHGDGSANAVNVINMGISVTGSAGINTTVNYGIKANANSSSFSPTSYGIYASIDGSVSASSYAGYFTAGSATSNVAFFNGPQVSTTSPIIISDKKFKDNIKAIVGALDKIMQLRPSVYSYFGKDKFPSFNFPTGKQYGFVAQELEKVLPEIVEEKINPALYDTSNNKITDAVDFKAIKYTEIIPMLTAAMQEQQAIIEYQNDKILSLEDRIAKLEFKKTNVHHREIIEGAELLQNTPNPLKDYTTISYTLPITYKQASISIYDINGKLLKSYDLNSNGKGELYVSAAELSAAMYLYTLMVDGYEVGTKRMIVNK